MLRARERAHNRYREAAFFAMYSRRFFKMKLVVTKCFRANWFLSKPRGLLRERPSQAGVTLVESAIILPLFILLIFSAIEFGYFMFESIVIESATNIVARQSKVGTLVSAANLEDSVRDQIQVISGGLVASEKVVITTDTKSWPEIKADLAKGTPPGLILTRGVSVKLRVFHERDALMPLTKFFGTDGKLLVRSTAFILNENA
jgi:hypothetical protein